MATTNQIAALAIKDMQDTITDDKEYAIILKKTGTGKVSYPIVDATVPSSLKSLILSQSESVWAGNSTVSIGQGFDGQHFTNDVWLYTCVSDGYWSRSLVISNVIDIILDTVNDSAGLFTISALNAAYPDAVPPQRIRGVAGYYERDIADNWFYVATTALAAN